MPQVTREVQATVKILVPVEVAVTFTLVGKEGAPGLYAIRQFLAGKEVDDTAVSFGGLTVTNIGTSPVSTGKTADLGVDLTEAVNENLNGGDGFKSELLTADYTKG